MIVSIPCTIEYTSNTPPDDAHAPIDMHHLGCGIWSQILRSTGAILYETRPAQISRSACRGENDMRSMPKRARSYLDAALAIISIAQHAVPNGIGHSELRRDQFTSQSSLVVMKSGAPSFSFIVGSMPLRASTPIPAHLSSRCR